MTSPSTDIAAEGAHSWSSVLRALVSGEALSSDAATWAMHQIMTGDASPSQIAGFAIALRTKGETVEEIEGLVATMYRHAQTLDVPGQIVDVVGTGGDMARTVNISTMSAIVAAGAGARVVKHGNRAASSSSGAADVLEALGLRLDLPIDRVAQIALEAGITFCFAPVFHPALRHAAVTRKELGVQTAFNMLGPLTNPARPRAQAVGVADRRMAPIVAGVLAKRGNSALVFRGDDGLDELTVASTSTVWVAHGGVVTEESFDPRAVGIGFAPVEALRGADAAYNAAVVRKLLSGERGPVRDAVLLSAGATLAALDGLGVAPGELPALTQRLAAGIARADEALDSGAAQAALDRWIEATSRAV
ncbi:anthranilate phosphoribosyltransferase [Actinocrinis puniceicyclus]|uniref:Anthranilate phosphoribosyltransferase n=1 Tax=Actinocrinis puniceicyclus TaxID=977794 RepID=A0A8J7WJI0_9ACTN|nr:anthranilate phosphoribosyltransferase [Actinocrinis puniceicyclus]MBS2963451.1 anthranilate phosphoribosyltransferase [Actinocrinis puniceicyclus]